MRETAPRPPGGIPDGRTLVASRVGREGRKGEFHIEEVGTAFGIRVRSREKQSGRELRRRLKLRGKNAEMNANIVISDAQKAADERLALYKEHGEVATEFDECRAELAEVNELGKRLYAKSVTFRNAEIAQLNHEARLRRMIERDYAAANFPWFQLMSSVFPILHFEGFSEASGWRGKAYDIIVAIEVISRAPLEEGGMNLPRNP